MWWCRRTWSVFLHPGGERILFRFGPDFVAFTRGRALSRSSGFLFFFRGRRRRKGVSKASLEEKREATSSSDSWTTMARPKARGREFQTHSSEGNVFPQLGDWNSPSLFSWGIPKRKTKEDDDDAPTRCSISWRLFSPISFVSPLLLLYRVITRVVFSSWSFCDASLYSSS